MKERTKEFRDGAKQRNQQDHILLEQAFENLQNILDQKEMPPPVSKEDQLFHACQRVGSDLGLKFTPLKNQKGSSEERLQDLCVHSQIYFRRVKLTPHFWKQHSFPFVAFYGKSQEPVALVPAHGGGYQIIQPHEESPRLIDDEEEKNLSSSGYMFYRQIKAPKLSVRTIWNFVISERRKEWLSFLFLVLCSTLASLTVPIFTGFIFDEVIPNRQEFYLWEVALGSLIISLSTIAFHFGREVLLLRLESLSDHDMEMAVWQRLIQLPIRFFKKNSIFELFTFTSAISSIRKLLVSNAVQVVFDAMFSVIYFFLMFYYSSTLAFVGLSLICIELIALFAPFYFGILYGRKLLDKQIQASNKMLEMVQALTKVRLAGIETRMFKRWESAFSDMTKTEINVMSLHLKSGGFNLFWSNASTWILYVSVAFVLFGQHSSAGALDLTLGGFMAFIAAFGLFNHALTGLGHTLLSIVDIVPLWEKTKYFTEAEPEDVGAKADPGTLQGEIRVDHLTFSYQPDIPPIVQNISLEIYPGESVAFVGPSGCGKTTLLKLLLGFERSNQGSIYFDNKDIRGVNLQAVRRQLGVVLQSGGIFDGTILENISSGRHYTPQQAREALSLIGADSLIEELPMGINTVLTNGGLSLSGGQKQLILLARAIVGRPKILILDEATSALDNHKQKIIYEHLGRLEMTQIIVAQRLDTIQHVDRIYVIDQGKIVDTGTFTELANKPGLFADLLHHALD